MLKFKKSGLAAFIMHVKYTLKALITFMRVIDIKDCLVILKKTLIYIKVVLLYIIIICLHLLLIVKLLQSIDTVYCACL